MARDHSDSEQVLGRAPKPALNLSGLEPLTVPRSEASFMMIGERTNVTGSPRFRKLIKEGNFEEALAVARQQVENGANMIDVNFDEGLLDGEASMTKFLNLIAAEPDISRVRYQALPQSGLETWSCSLRHPADLRQS